MELKIIVTLLSLLATPPALNAQGGPVDKEKLAARVEELARKYRVPDYCIAFVNEDSLLFTIDKNKENAGKNYLIGSCSKSFTALAVMKLSDEGKIDPDMPVRHYLPWFELSDSKLTDSVTVRRLLNHKSGFERQYGFFDVATGDAALYEQKLAEYIRSINIRFAPGRYFLYSNLNYVLLGLIVQHVTGLSYSEYLNASVLPAAGMKNTWCTFRQNNSHDLIRPYHYIACGIPFRSKTYRYSDFMVPAGYISSNAVDLASYIRFMLRRCVTAEGDTILRQPACDMLTGGTVTGYAMGWFNSDYDSVRIIRHTGLDENYASSLDFYPDRHTGWAVLCNVNSLEFCDRVDQTIDASLRGKPEPVFRSNEIIIRWTAFLMPLLLLAGAVFNLVRWSRYGFRTGIVTRILPGLRLITGIFLSIVGLIFVTKAFQMNIVSGIRFDPDIMWGLILIAFIGILSSFARYFGTYSKSIKNSA
jgi:CubicO group peptidase (beta-lactamase class C family)